MFICIFSASDSYVFVTCACLTRMCTRIYVWHVRVWRGYAQVCVCKLCVPEKYMYKYTYAQVTHMYLYVCVLRDLSCCHLRVSDALLLSIASRLLRSLVTDPSHTTPTNLIQCRYSALFIYVWPSLSLYRIMSLARPLALARSLSLLRVCIYIYICIHIHIYVYIYVHIYVYMYIYMCIYAYIYTWVNIYIYIHTHACLCITYTNMYIWVYLYKN